MTTVKRFDAVFFDLDDTLFDTNLMSFTARKNAIRAIREAGVELDENKTFNLLEEIVLKYGSNYGEHFNRLLEVMDYEAHPKLIAAAVVAYHSSKQALLRPFPGVILTLLRLMKEMKIGIISDGIKIKQWEKLTYLGIQHFFDVVVINDTPNHWKPSEYGYKLAMQKLKLEDPKKILFVGNRIESDIVGANRIHMNSVLFDPTSKVDLEKLTGYEKPNFVIKQIQEVVTLVNLEPIYWRF